MRELRQHMEKQKTNFIVYSFTTTWKKRNTILLRQDFLLEAQKVGSTFEDNPKLGMLMPKKLGSVKNKRKKSKEDENKI